MKTLTTFIYLAVAAVALACFALLPAAQAVVPAPDGAYPGFNTAQGGPTALGQAVPGVWNTAIGQFALNLDVSGGTGNTAVGLNALRANTLGDFNSALGVNALRFNVIGSNNTALGYQALFVNIGNMNTAVGVNALSHNTTGFDNAAVGQGALGANILGAFNTAFGFQALASNITDDNTAVGWKALVSNTSGGQNTAVGSQALLNNTTISGISGTDNTAIGFNAHGSDVTGISNVAVGSGALANAIHGFNIAVGADAGSGVTTALGVIAIGSSGANVGGSCFIGNIRGVATNNANAIPVVIDSFGQLGTMSSSQRFKKDIKPMEGTSGSVLNLKPVTFHYKNDKSNIPQFGLIAEEVAKIDPDLVAHDKDGEIYTVRYDAVNTMLLNEFLKEHKKVEAQGREIVEQKATISELRKEMATFNARLKEQDSRLQKVSAQMALEKPAPQTIVDIH